MNVLFTKRRSIIAPTASGNYPAPVHPNSATFYFFSGALIRKKYGSIIVMASGNDGQNGGILCIITGRSYVV